MILSGATIFLASDIMWSSDSACTTHKYPASCSSRSYTQWHTTITVIPPITQARRIWMKKTVAQHFCGTNPRRQNTVGGLSSYVDKNWFRNQGKLTTVLEETLSPATLNSMLFDCDDMVVCGNLCMYQWSLGRGSPHKMSYTCTCTSDPNGVRTAVQGKCEKRIQKYLEMSGTFRRILESDDQKVPDMIYF